MLGALTAKWGSAVTINANCEPPYEVLSSPSPPSNEVNTPWFAARPSGVRAHST